MFSIHDNLDHVDRPCVTVSIAGLKLSMSLGTGAGDASVCGGTTTSATQKVVKKTGPASSTKKTAPPNKPGPILT